jgi:DNA-binding transcriptional MerR regulator
MHAPGGARAFSADEIGWLRILRWLRDTGMSMAALRRFCASTATPSPVDGDSCSNSIEHRYWRGSSELCTSAPSSTARSRPTATQ